MFRSIPFAFLVLSLSAPLWAQPEAPVEPSSEESLEVAPLTPEESKAVEWVHARARKMVRHDRAAWQATDQLTESRWYRREKRLRGWVTEEIDDGVRVTFIGTESKRPDPSDPPMALYRVLVRNNESASPKLERLKPAEPLSEFEASAWAVRQHAIAQSYMRCGKSMNSIVFPNPEREHQWVVYLMPGMQGFDSIPIGGAHRFVISNDPLQVVESRALNKSCMVLDYSSAAVGEGAKVVAAMITHLMDPTPTEVHVFWNLIAGKPIMVSTDAEHLWSIYDGQIELLDLSSEDGDEDED